MDALARLSAATAALAQAKTLDEVKQIIDIAEAARTYARAAKLGLEAANHAAEVKLRAERKAGELLAALAEQTEKGGDRRSENFNNSRMESLNGQSARPGSCWRSWSATIREATGDLQNSRLEF